MFKNNEAIVPELPCTPPSPSGEKVGKIGPKKVKNSEEAVKPQECEMGAKSLGLTACGLQRKRRFGFYLECQRTARPQYTGLTLPTESPRSLEKSCRNPTYGLGPHRRCRRHFRRGTSCQSSPNAPCAVSRETCPTSSRAARSNVENAAICSWSAEGTPPRPPQRRPRSSARAIPRWADWISSAMAATGAGPTLHPHLPISTTRPRSRPGRPANRHRAPASQNRMSGRRPRNPPSRPPNVPSRKKPTSNRCRSPRSCWAYWPWSSVWPAW